MPERAAHNHPSLARERTGLAWGRTGVSLVAVGALAVRVGVLENDLAPGLAAGLVLAIALAGIMVTRRPRRRVHVADPLVIAADVRALVFTVAACGVLSVALIALSVGSAS